MDVHINIQYILQNKTKKKFVGIIRVYCTCNWIRSDPNAWLWELLLHSRNGKGVTVPSGVVAGEGEI